MASKSRKVPLVPPRVKVHILFYAANLLSQTNRNGGIFHYIINIYVENDTEMAIDSASDIKVGWFNLLSNWDFRKCLQWWILCKFFQTNSFAKMYFNEFAGYKSYCQFYLPENMVFGSFVFFDDILFKIIPPTLCLFLSIVTVFLFLSFFANLAIFKLFNILRPSSDK